MKKQLSLTVLFILITLAGIAQSKSSSFNNGDNLINLGFGIGSPYFGSGYKASLPINPSFSYEKGVSDVISVGGQLSYASSKFDDSFNNDYNFKEHAVYIGARGSYHFNQLLQLDNKFDLYGGASLGYVTVSVSDNTGSLGATGSGLGLGLFGGGKYYFSQGTAIYAELGYQSLALLNVGIAFKF